MAKCNGRCCDSDNCCSLLSDSDLANDGLDPHTCPYKVDINNDYELCNCCANCTAQCADDI